jgi:hypothetical protein
METPITHLTTLVANLKQGVDDVEDYLHNDKIPKSGDIVADLKASGQLVVDLRRIMETLQVEMARVESLHMEEEKRTKDALKIFTTEFRSIENMIAGTNKTAAAAAATQPALPSPLPSNSNSMPQSNGHMHRVDNIPIPESISNSWQEVTRHPRHRISDDKHQIAMIEVVPGLPIPVISVASFNKIKQPYANTPYYVQNEMMFYIPSGEFLMPASIPYLVEDGSKPVKLVMDHAVYTKGRKLKNPKDNTFYVPAYAERGNLQYLGDHMNVMMTMRLVPFSLINEKNSSNKPLRIGGRETMLNDMNSLSLESMDQIMRIVHYAGWIHLYTYTMLYNLRQIGVKMPYE